MVIKKEEVILHMDPAETVLLHAGKKGMKWRQRKLPLPGEQQAGDANSQPGDMVNFQEQAQGTTDAVSARLAIASSRALKDVDAAHDIHKKDKKIKKAMNRKEFSKALQGVLNKTKESGKAAW